MTLIELARMFGGTIAGDSLHTQLAGRPIRIDRRRKPRTTQLCFDLVVDGTVHATDDIVAAVHALVPWPPIAVTDMDDAIHEKRWRRWRKRARRIPVAVGTALIRVLLRRR